MTTWLNWLLLVENVLGLIGTVLLVRILSHGTINGRLRAIRNLVLAVAFMMVLLTAGRSLDLAGSTPWWFVDDYRTLCFRTVLVAALWRLVWMLRADGRS